METGRFVKRSNLRLFAGKVFYTVIRYFKWYFGKEMYAKTRKDSLFSYTAFSHKTPLIRNLQKLEMWLQYNKIINLEIAAGRLDGIIVHPGETFSYWRLIGKPTKRKGYLKGAILVNGEVRPGVGGGLCQLSNLIYWMTLHTPLTVTERYRHTHDVFPDSGRNQPFGSGATCVYNYIDLQIYNGTKNPYQLHVYLTGDYLVGEWRTIELPQESYEVYEKEHWITHEFWGGYMRHNKIYRRLYNIKNELIQDEYVTENHAIMMYQPFLSECTDSKA